MRAEKSFSSPMRRRGCGCSREARRAGGVQPVLVAVLGGHDAVGGHEDGAVEGPRTPPSASTRRCRSCPQSWGTFERRDSSGRAASQSGCKRPRRCPGSAPAASPSPAGRGRRPGCRVFAHADVHLGDLGIAVGLGVGLVQQGHALPRRTCRSPGPEQPDRLPSGGRPAWQPEPCWRKASTSSSSCSRALACLSRRKGPFNP